MKISSFIATFLIITIVGISSRAQNASENEEVKAKVAEVIEKFTVNFKFEKNKRSTIEEIFTDFYSGQQKLKNHIQRPASGLAQGLASQDFQSIRKKNEILIEERDKRLKKELSEEELKKWKTLIEPSLRTGRKDK